MKEEMFDSFFTGGAEFWIGKVVAIDAQKQTAQGFSWGWRYKVRIFGTYSNSDNITVRIITILCLYEFLFLCNSSINVTLI